MATKHWVALDSPCEVGASAPSSSELGAGAPARPWVARAPRAEGGAAHRPVLPGARRRSRNLIEPLLERGANPSLCAAIHRVGERMEEVSWGRLIDRVRAASEGLVELGIEPGDRVCIFAPTRVDWCVADLAIMGVGAVTAPIYASNTPEEIEHVLRDSGARALFIDGEVGEGGASGRWSRIRAAMAQVPALERVIAFDLPSDPASRLLSLADLEERGRKRLADHPRGLEERSRALGPDDLACICYTTGTTGVSKGVMLTHGTWTYQAQAVTQVGLMAQADIVLLFLPLAHSFGKVVQAAWLDQGFPLAFARSPETAVDDAAAVGATVMPAVPRLFEKAFAKVVGEAGAQPGIKGRLFRWAMEQFDQYAVARLEGREFDSLQWRLARRVVFAKIQKRLQARFGGRMRAFISGSAPLSRRIALFFEECGLAILEGYGLTETAAPTHVNRPDFIRLGTVGLPFPEVETRIADDGEVLLRGPQVMKGYYGKPELTAEVLDADGWLHTGDIGEIDPEGCLRITDRKKDLIKTSGGKYLAPQQLEQMLAAIPLVSHVVVIGDRRRFVSALFTISAEEGGRWAAEAGLGLASYEALVRDPALRARIQAALDEINARLPSYATIKKFAILEREFSIENGELTAKLSVRRKVVAERYKAIVDELYGDAVID